MQKEASTLIRDTAPLAESSLQYEEAASLKAYQWARLRETLEYLELHSPFYQHFFRQKGVKVPDIRSREDFSALPFTTKEDLQLHNSGFLCIPQNRVIDHCSTSGTMGEPVHILLS